MNDIAAEKTIPDDTIDPDTINIRQETVIVHMKVQPVGRDAWQFEGSIIEKRNLS